MTLYDLTTLFASTGCKKLYAKSLAENDNSKNQVYFGPGFEALNLFPNEGIVPDSSPKNPIFKTKLKFGWLLSNGMIAEAPNAQLILYPQYPEVRFSGFLLGCSSAPSEIMRARQKGRVLFLGVTEAKKIAGFVVSVNSSIAAEFRSNYAEPTAGVFNEILLPNTQSDAVSRSKLLAELRRINLLGWIDSKQLGSDGKLKPCNAPQCGGFTLEAELGIPKNSSAEPDFLGWEVKQHTVSNFKSIEVGIITLMTPEPTGGYYRESGVEAFVRDFGYADKKGQPDRMNFGGIHRADKRHVGTHLTIVLQGYDATKGLITDVAGCVALMSDSGQIAASWAFSGLLEHWAKKHARAVYVPSQCRKGSMRQYYYGDTVRLAQGTDSLKLLKAFANGKVYYDPGIKLENISGKAKAKKRNQFRIAARSIDAIYDTVDIVKL